MDEDYTKAHDEATAKLIAAELTKKRAAMRKRFWLS